MRWRASWPPSVRQTIADLDLNYYLPCTVRGRTIAFLGVSRTETGEFLSSDDVELLLTLVELCRHRDRERESVPLAETEGRTSTSG